MPKISTNAGHTHKAPGASGHLDEVTEDRKIRAALEKYLRQAGWSVHDSTTEEATSSADLSMICSKANASGSGYFVSIHLNSGGGSGTEVYYSPTSRSDWGKTMAAKISAALASLMGIRNRGAKANNFYVLKHTNMPAILIEICFVDSAADAEAYRRVGPDAIGKAIAECIVGKAIGTPQAAKAGWYKDSHGWWYENGDGSYKRNQWFNPSRGEWYWLGANGYAAMGWTLLDGTWYYFAKADEPEYQECQMVADAWRKDSKGVDYWLSGDGSMATSRWVDHARYYVGPDGTWDKSR